MTYRTIRRIEGLTYASPCAEQFKTEKKKGLRAAGITYERLIGKTLKRAGLEPISGQWFRFIDKNGQGYCQIDHYVVLDSHILLFEAKRTQNRQGLQQINWLYRPVLKHLYNLPVVGILVCKYMHEETKWEITDPLALAPEDKTYTWHYF